MSFRQKFLGYSGGLMIIFGMLLNILGWETGQHEAFSGLASASFATINAAAGVPMWTGLIIIMCGLSNLMSAFDKKKKSERRAYELPFSFSVMLANLIALVMSALCIGLLSWSLYEAYLKTSPTGNTYGEAVVGLYSNIIIMACFIFIFAFMSLFIDCCLTGFIGLGMPVMGPFEVRESPYSDTYNRNGPAFYKP